MGELPCSQCLREKANTVAYSLTLFPISISDNKPIRKIQKTIVFLQRSLKPKFRLITNNHNIFKLNTLKNKTGNLQLIVYV